MNLFWGGLKDLKFKIHSDFFLSFIKVNFIHLVKLKNIGKPMNFNSFAEREGFEPSISF
jgi:hypothetical protein